MVRNVTLNLEDRTELGKGGARRLRMEGKVPCVVYGRGVETKSLIVDNRDLLSAVAGHPVSNLILDLQMTGDEAKALIRDIQLDPVTHSVLHVDFQRVSLTEKLEVEVPVELVGNPTGVKDDGGILSHALRTLTVRCLPGDIPEQIEVDVTNLAINEAIHVSDLATQAVEIVNEGDMLIASVNAPSLQLEAEPAEGEEGEEGEGEEGEGEAKAEGEEGDSEESKEEDKS